VAVLASGLFATPAVAQTPPAAAPSPRSQEAARAPKPDEASKPDEATEAGAEPEPEPEDAATPEEEASTEPEPPPRATLELRYGAAHHSGQQQLGTGALQYTDSVFNDLGLYGSAFTNAGWGGLFSVQQEALTVSAQEEPRQVTHAPLLRLQVALAARWVLGPLLLQPSLGYGLAQLPSVTTLEEPRLLRAVRRSTLFGLRARVPLTRTLHAELRGEVPLPFFAIDGQGRRMTTSGAVAGVAVGHALTRSGAVGSALLLDYQFTYDRFTVDATRGAYQRISRLGLALELRLWPKGSP
jgi:hypothetical protein